MVKVVVIKKVLLYINRWSYISISRKGLFMKKNSRLLSVLLIMIMVLTSSVMISFAENGSQDANVDEAELELMTSEPVSDTAKNSEAYIITFNANGGTGSMDTVTLTPGEDGTAAYSLPDCGFTAPEGKVFNGWDQGAAGKSISVTGDMTITAQWKDEVVVPAAPGNASGLTANTDGKTVKLSWKGDSRADTYDVYVGGKYKATTSATNYTLTVSPYYNTNFKVKAFKSYEDNGETKYVPSPEFSNVVYWNGIKAMSIKFKVKSACSLKSHGGKKQTLKLKKGQVITASMFSGGKYIFKMNGSVFWMNRTRAKSPAAYYTKSFDYSWEEAENFVNQYGIGSSTKQMIWVSTYTQRAYYFTGTRGNWTCRRSWDVSTGKASTPTPTGKTYGTMAIQKKLKNRHSIPYWSCFSSFNAFHGKKKSWKMGAPASGGCVRNNVSDAQWIYNNVSKKSRAFVY